MPPDPWLTAALLAAMARDEASADTRDPRARVRALRDRLGPPAIDRAIVETTDPSKSHWQRYTNPAFQAFLRAAYEDLRAFDDPPTSYTWGTRSPALAVLPPADRVSNAVLLHAQSTALAAHSPLFVLDETAARALCETDLPGDEIGEVFLPYPGFYLELPPIFDLVDPVSGLHALEGAWVAQDRVATRAGAPLVPGTVVVTMGKAKGQRTGKLGAPEVDDTFRFTAFTPQSRVAELHGASEADLLALRLVINFLYALRGNYLATERIVPVLPRSPGKAKKLARRGRGLVPYTLVRLRPSPVPTSTRPRDPATDPRASPRPHAVRWHWVSYWKIDPGTEPTHGTRVREDQVLLHRVRRWIPPLLRGHGEGAAPRYRVKG